MYTRILTVHGLRSGYIPALWLGLVRSSLLPPRYCVTIIEMQMVDGREQRPTSQLEYDAYMMGGAKRLFERHGHSVGTVGTVTRLVATLVVPTP